MAKRIITMDIETLPTSSPFDEKIVWETEEEYRNTGFNGMFGRILCIGYIEDSTDEKPLTYGCFGWREESKDFETDERKVLTDWWEFMKTFNVTRDLIIGHNILNFDLPFIIQRSIVLNVKPTVQLPLRRYQSAPVYDTMQIWKSWGNQGGPGATLNNLSIALGLESPKAEGIAGDKVYDEYLAGNHQQLFEYCMRDVKATRNVYRRMNFTYPVKEEE